MSQPNPEVAQLRADNERLTRLVAQMQDELEAARKLREALQSRSSLEEGWHGNPDNHTLAVTLFFGSFDPRPLIDWKPTHAQISSELLDYLAGTHPLAQVDERPRRQGLSRSPKGTP